MKSLSTSLLKAFQRKRGKDREKNMEQETYRQKQEETHGETNKDKDRTNQAHPTWSCKRTGYSFRPVGIMERGYQTLQMQIKSSQPTHAEVKMGIYLLT